MIISQVSLNALRTVLSSAFTVGLKKVTTKHEVFTTKVTASTKVQTYGFLAEPPKFRKWLGEKRIKSLAEKAYQLVNDAFEQTIGIHKHQIADDNLGLYAPMVSGWGQTSAELGDRLAFEALRDGNIRECYDGQNFFDAEHPVGDGVVSNINTAATVQPWYLLDCSQALKPILLQEREAPHFHMVTNMQDSEVMKTGNYLMGAEARYGAGYTYWQLAYRSTATLDAAGYQAAKDAGQALVNDEGEPSPVRYTHCVAGRSNIAAARALFTKAALAGGESNIWLNDVVVIEAEWLP